MNDYGASGKHSVCVCTIHQNAVLLVEAAQTGVTYKDMIDNIVCNREMKDCMVHRCDMCPGTEPLRSYLKEVLSDIFYEEISFQQWQSTDRAQLVTQSMGIDEFIELLTDKIDALTPHSYIATASVKRRFAGW